MPQPTLLASRDYFSALVSSVKKAQSHISIISFNLTCDDETQPLFDALEAAIDRGVSVRISGDSMTFLELAGKILGPVPLDDPTGDTMRAIEQRFKKKGAHFTWLGKTDVFNPYRGRTHSKWSVIDDTIYSFGGINIYKTGIQNTDYMFKVVDAKLANILLGEHKKIDQDRYTYNGNTTTTSLGTVYIDKGKRRQSVIYDRACELAEQATSALFVSQYYPSGRLARLLKKKTYFYMSRPSITHSRGNWLLLMLGKFVSPVRNSYTRPQYLHAKFIIFTMPNGKKIALTGSHNFAYSGVLFGTAEIELETSNEDIIAQLEAFADRHIKTV